MNLTFPEDLKCGHSGQHRGLLGVCYGHTPAAGMGLLPALGDWVPDEVQEGLTPSYIARGHMLQACLSSQRFASHIAAEPHAPLCLFLCLHLYFI